MNKEQFELNKLKYDSEKKVNISYKKMITDGSATYADIIDVVSPRTPHPDLLDALKNLGRSLAESNELFIHRDQKILTPSQRENFSGKIMERILNTWDEKVMDSVEVSGISLQGDIETGSCVITGKHKTHNTAVAMNSPKISFSGDSFGIETEVRDLVKVLKEEAYLYIFENKAAQLELFDEAEKQEEKVVDEELVDA